MRETLLYAAYLRLPKQQSRAQKAGHVDDIVDALGVRKSAGTIIGAPRLLCVCACGSLGKCLGEVDPVHNLPVTPDTPDTLAGGFLRRGISGGERKRVSIGHELLTDPAVLLLGEWQAPGSTLPCCEPRGATHHALYLHAQYGRG